MTKTLRPGAPEEVGMLPERVARVRELCAHWVRSGHTPALAVCVARRGVVVLHEAFGRRRPGDDSPPLQVDSIFPVSSITKPMTATVAMQLVEDGVLGLNRPVRDYIPEICGKGTEELLVDHLFTHTSGYNDLEMAPYIAAQLKNGFDPGPCPQARDPLAHKFLTLCYPLHLWKPPGTEMSYCNHNYVLLGEIIRRLTRRPLGDLLQERLFDPLGMTDSWHGLPDSTRRRMVERGFPLYREFEAGFPYVDARAWEETPGAGHGVFSTAKDLAIFGQMFLNGGTYGGVRILSRAAVTAMTRNQIPGIGAQMGPTFHKEASYGYGWMIASQEKWKYFVGSLLPPNYFAHTGHGGAGLLVDPTNEIVAVYLEVTLRCTELLEPLWNADLFENAVYAALAD